MLRMLYPLVFFFLSSTAAAQSDLTELLSIFRAQASVRSDSSSARAFKIIKPYGNGVKSFSGEWETINEGLTDANPFVRDQMCAVLAATGYVNPTRPLKLPDTTREILIQRFSDSVANLRENAVRVIAQSDGGIPAASVPKLLQMAQADSSDGVRRVAISALVSVQPHAPEVTEFLVKSLNDAGNTPLRGSVLHTFRFFAQTDPRIIALVIDALKDKDYFVRQEAIAAIIKIGKPASAALPLLDEIRDQSSPASEMDQVLRQNAESAIRLLSEQPVR